MKTSLTFRAANATANSSTAIRTTVLGLLPGAAAWSTPALAQEVQAVHTKQADAESLWLTIDNPAQHRMQVRVVQRSTNACISNEVNHQSSYGCKLNFSKLPAGQYDVVMRVGQERYRYSVEVQAQHSTISVREMTKEVAGKSLASASL